MSDHKIPIDFILYHMKAGFHKHFYLIKLNLITMYNVEIECFFVVVFFNGALPP